MWNKDIIIAECKKNLALIDNENPKVILALSGGPDSIALGECLTMILPAESIVVAHFDHGWRNTSATDSDFCKEWSEHHKCIFVNEKWQNPKKTEEAARDARGDFLARMQKKHKANAICLGAHADDQSETILFRIIRGAGPRGLSGMRIWGPETGKLRPLLRVPKQALLDLLREGGISFVTDDTNLDTTYDRNYLRHEVLPKIAQRFPHAAKNINDAAELQAEVADFLEDAARMFLGKQHLRGAEWRVDRYGFQSLPRALQGEILRQTFIESLTYSQIQNLREFVTNGTSQKKLSIGKNTLLLGVDVFFVQHK